MIPHKVCLFPSSKKMNGYHRRLTNPFYSGPPLWETKCLFKFKKKKHYVHLKCKVNVWQDFSQNEITKSQIINEVKQLKLSQSLSKHISHNFTRTMDASIKLITNFRPWHHASVRGRLSEKFQHIVFVAVSVNIIVNIHMCGYIVSNPCPVCIKYKWWKVWFLCRPNIVHSTVREHLKSLNSLAKE